MGGVRIGKHCQWEVGHYAEREHARVSECAESNCDQGLRWIGRLSTKWQCSVSWGPSLSGYMVVSVYGHTLR